MYMVKISAEKIACSRKFGAQVTHDLSWFLRTLPVSGRTEIRPLPVKKFVFLLRILSV